MMYVYHNAAFTFEVSILVYEVQLIFKRDIKMKNTAVQNKNTILLSILFILYTVYQGPLNTSWNYNTNRSNM